MISMYELIVAMDEKNGIAKNNKIPWYNPTDLKFFKEKTEYNIVIMGRKTFESLPYRKALKNRLHIVLTRNPNDFRNIPNVIFTNDIEHPINYDDYPYLKENPIKFIIGGGEIFKEYGNICNIWWVTIIKNDYNCDVFFTINNNVDSNKSTVVKENEYVKIYKISYQ